MRKNEPKYMLLAKRLMYDIDQGKLQPGDSLPSFKELRQSDGISQFTYEKAYDVLQAEGVAVRQRGRYGGVFVTPRQRPTTVKPVGYFHVAQWRHLHLSYFAYLLEGIRQEASQFGCQVLLVDEIYAFKAWDTISAAIIMGNQPQQALTFREQMPAGFPAVSLVLPVEGMHSVVADDYLGSYRGAQYLIELGHRNIGYVNYPSPKYPTIGIRRDGYRQALIDAGIEPQPQWSREFHLLNGTTDQDFQDFGRELMLDWLRDGFAESGVTALMTQNDNVAYGMIRVLEKTHYRVPQDISFIGFDGILYNNELIEPKLTSLEIPVREIGRTAVTHVLTAGPKPQKITLPVRLRVGETTGPPPK